MTDYVKIKKHTEDETPGSNEETSEQGNSGEAEAPKAEDPLKEMQAKIETLEQEAKQSYDRFLRVSAEFENYKKRSAREMDEFRKFANESLIRELLPVVDNLERAIHSSGKDENVNGSIVEGVDMTLQEVLKIFERFSVKPIESLGKTFDPSYHQAVMQESSEDHAENTVSRELQKGYMIHDRLLRPAMVAVAMAKTKNENSSESEPDK